MGLDISIYKVQPLGDRNPNKVQNYISLDYNTELTRFFGKFSFKKTMKYLNVEKRLQEMKLNPSDYRISAIAAGGKGTTVFTLTGPGNKQITIDDAPLVKEIETCIMVKEVGYQRKGANEKFYTDGMWDSRCITSKAQLLKHWNEYFSGPKEIKKRKFSSFGFGVEFDHSPEEARANFKKNIIDKFVEGQTFVSYH